MSRADRLSAVEDDSGWRIEVCDTGPGLAKRARPSVPTITPAARRGGTGLGLAIAADLVQGHGGTLTLVKTGPDGTCFAIALPKTVLGETPD